MDLLDLLRERDGWSTAIERLRALHAARGAQAKERAAQCGRVYLGRRAAMVFDVVASRQRRYEQRVVPLVERFAQLPAAGSLKALASHGPGPGFGLRSGEADTMQGVAAGLVRFAERHGLDHEEAVRTWAESTEIVVEAPGLDPYVGAVRGIGVALFAYLRMRSGGDGIKPDLRVRRALTDLGFELPLGDVALLRTAGAAGAELGISLLELDQLLWSTQ